jgi:hypothetical protein
LQILYSLKFRRCQKICVLFGTLWSNWCLINIRLLLLNCLNSKTSLNFVHPLVFHLIAVATTLCSRFWNPFKTKLILAHQQSIDIIQILPLKLLTWIHTIWLLLTGLLNSTCLIGCCRSYDSAWFGNKAIFDYLINILLLSYSFTAIA